MYLFFDTETTGLPRSWVAPESDSNNWPRVVQLAWSTYDADANQLSSQNFIIKPEGFTIPEEVVKIHGISTERAEKEGVPLKEALMAFTGALQNTKIIVAHNIVFDHKVLAAEFHRLNMSHQINETPKFCTMRSTVEFCKLPHFKGGYKFPKLQELHQHLFKEDFKNAHNALHDVDACARCFFELKRKGLL